MRVILYTREKNGQLIPMIFGAYSDNCDLKKLADLCAKLNANPGMHMSYPSQDQPNCANYRYVLILENVMHITPPSGLEEQLNHPRFVNPVEPIIDVKGSPTDVDNMTAIEAQTKGKG